MVLETRCAMTLQKTMCQYQSHRPQIGNKGRIERITTLEPNSTLILNPIFLKVIVENSAEIEKIDRM